MWQVQERVERRKAEMAVFKGIDNVEKNEAYQRALTPTPHTLFLLMSF